MKKLNILTFTMVAAFISGCSITSQPSMSDIEDKYNSKLELKNDRDYIAYVAREKMLNIVDGKEHKLYKSCEITGIQAPGGLIISNDTKVAYVLQENMQQVNGYNLNTCELTFTAPLSYDNVIGRSMFSFNISPDDERLYVITSESEKQIDRYKVLDTQFSIYNTADGIGAKPVKRFKAPRQITVMGVDKNDIVSGPAFTALAKVLLGKAPANGVLPVTIKPQKAH